MVSVHQLELNLEAAFEEAAERPEMVNVLGLWQQFEDELAGLPQQEHLRVAGDILVQLAGLCETKSASYFGKIGRMRTTQMDL